MALASGIRLGSFEILGKVGEGGMGEVYRATDTTLEREVAIKVLPAEVAHDAERLARFAREAKLLASLNHANIAHVYGFESGTLAGGTNVHFLAMELVEGEDLAARLTRGAIPVDEALELARQIAEALEAAHEQGIVHRDLKPANIKVRDDGTVKVLDFGLAKALGPEGASGTADAMNSPTLTARATQVGVILGTAAYMAPEQARGKPVDKRADIWAFGVVVYEMLAGTRLFDPSRASGSSRGSTGSPRPEPVEGRASSRDEGDSVSDVLAAVLRQDIDFAALPADVPPSIRRLLRRCLERNPKNRLHDIADARIVLDEAIAGAPDDARPAPAAHGGPGVRALAGVAVVAAVAGALLGYFLSHGSTPGRAPQVVPRVSVSLPAGVRVFADHWPGRSVALSPDGREIVFVCVTVEGDDYSRTGRLCRRALDRFEVETLAGTDGARQPFFSPDGQWVGFFNEDAGVRKVSLATGKVLPIAPPFEGSQWAFGSWGEDGRIVFASFSSGLLSVAADGSKVETLVPFEGEWLEVPEHLPGTRTVLYRARGAAGVRVEAYDADRGARRVVLDHASHPRFVSPDRLLFARDGVLMTIAFDPKTATASGSPTPVEEPIAIDGEMSSDPTPHLALSRDGTLAYIAPLEPPERRAELFWIDREGRETPAATLSAIVTSVDLTADGRQALVATRHGDEVRFLLVDLERGTTTLVATSRPGSEITTPTLLPGDREFVFMSPVVERGTLQRASLDGGGSARTLFELDGSYATARSVSSDGRYLAVAAFRHGSWSDIWSVDLASGTPRPEPVLATPASEHSPALSPDGRWFAYVSNEDGNDAVYVRAFPGGAGKRRVSTRSGADPQWAKNGRELFFLSGSVAGRSLELQSAAVERSTATELRLGVPRRLFAARIAGGYDISRSYAASPDGSRFLAFRNTRERRALRPGREGESLYDLRVVPGWAEIVRGGKDPRAPTSSPR